MMYTAKEAQEVAERFREANPDAINVRVEKRPNGEYRAVYDHYISVGKKSQNKKFPVDRRLIASWGVHISPEAWEFIASPMTREQAELVKAEVEPLLPKGWSLAKNPLVGGELMVVKEGKKTLVTSHCEAC